jgi:hypothetical protein
LTSLNISNNGLSRGAHDGSSFYTDQHFATDTTGNCSSAGASSHTTDIAGIIALASAIKDMGALIKLNISSSRIGAEHEQDLQRICVAGGIELTK